MEENNNKHKKKKGLIILGTFLLLLVGVTFAYFYTTDTFTNLFNIGTYGADATEVFTSPDDWTPGTTTPKSLTVTNTGTVCENVRISLSEEWEDANGNSLPLKQNGNKAAIINFVNESDWIKNGNYYYYNHNLAANQSTNSFIESVTFNPDIENDFTCTQNGNKRRCSSTNSGYAKATYTLVFNIETIQCDAVEESWSLDPTDLVAGATFATGSVVNAKLQNLANGNDITAFERSDTLPNNFVASNDNTISASTSDYKNRYNNYQMSYEYYDLDECNKWKSVDYMNLYYNRNPKSLSCKKQGDSYYIVINGDSTYRYVSQSDCENNLYVNGSTCVASTISSNTPIYAWFDNGTIYYYSEADTVYLNEDSSMMLSNMRSLASISGLADVDASRVVNLTQMFSGDYGLTSLEDLSAWNTSNVKYMYLTFYGLGVTSLHGLENWDVSSVKKMMGVFNGCGNLTNIQALSNWDVSNATNMDQLFYGCTSLSNIQALASWQLNTSSDLSLSDLFGGCSLLSDLTPIANWDTSRVTDMNNLFGYTAITSLSSISSWDTSKVTNMSYMFYGCSGITSLAPISNWNISNVKNLDGMFDNCSGITSLNDISGWNTSKVELMNNLFNGCTGLTNLQGLSSWNTSGVTDMGSMFYGCTGITNLTGIGTWNVSKVEKFSYMFYGCTGITDLTGIGTWNVSKAENFSYMFSGCTGFTTLQPLSAWSLNTKSDIGMSYMFRSCTALTSLTGLGSWNTAKVISMRYMFQGCTSLSDASAINDWNISNVPYTSNTSYANGFYYMFNQCSVHPSFTNRTGTWLSGSFRPST